MGQYVLPEGTIYTNWEEWAGLLLGLVDNRLGYLPNWEPDSQEGVPEQLGALRYVLPLLSQCVAALEVLPLKIFLVSRQENQNVSGGATTADAYFKQGLNTEDYDPDGFVSLAGGDVTIAAGTWLLIGLPTVYRPNSCHAALYNVTAGARVAYGLSGFSDTASANSVWPMVLYPVVLANPTAFRLEVYASNAQSGNGGGVPSNKAVEKYGFLLGLKLE